LDGGQHAAPKQARRDVARTTFLERHGVQVQRYWNSDVLREPESVVASILRTLTLALSQGEREPGGTR
jgi:very-short-patch-repair endonuclease